MSNLTKLTMPRAFWSTFKLRVAKSLSRSLYEKLLDNSVSVKDFGAKGDGVTNDTDAFVNLIEYCNSLNKGASVIVPEGTYVITSKLPAFTNDVSIRGMGNYLSVLEFYGCDGLSFDRSGEGQLNLCTLIEDLGLHSANEDDRYTALHMTGFQSFGARSNCLIARGIACRGSAAKAQSAGWRVGIHANNVDELCIETFYFKGRSVEPGGFKEQVIGIQIDTGTGIRIDMPQIYFADTGLLITGQSEGLILNGGTLVALGVGCSFRDLVIPANNHVISDTHFSCTSRAIEFVTDTSTQSHYINNCFFLERNGSSSKVNYTAIYARSIERSIISSCTIQSNGDSTPSRVGLDIAGDGDNIISNLNTKNVGLLFNLAVTVGKGTLYVNNILNNGNVTGIFHGDYSKVSGTVPQTNSYNQVHQSRADATFKIGGNSVLTIGGSSYLFGNKGSNTNFKYFDFYTGTVTASNASQRMYFYGNASNDGYAGGAIFYMQKLSLEGDFVPQVDDAFTLGDADSRWSDIYAANGVISTSDERSKVNITEISDDILDAWASVPKKLYQFKDAFEKKGESARYHAGVIAQDIKAAFELHGLDPFAYGVLCYNEWDKESLTHEVEDPETKQSRTVVVKEADTGARYGVRYEQVAILDIALERRERLRLEQKLDTLLSTTSNAPSDTPLP